LPDVKTEVSVPRIANAVPHLQITWDTKKRGVSVAEMVKQLREGSPSIEVPPGSSSRRRLSIGVWMMEPGDDAIVGERIHAILNKA
jgi:L-seryl-tRNA(Ser) seleniumtransferase